MYAPSRTGRAWLRALAAVWCAGRRLSVYGQQRPRRRLKDVLRHASSHRHTTPSRDSPTFPGSQSRAAYETGPGIVTVP